MNKTFSSIKDIVEAYNSMVDKYTGVPVKEVPDRDLYVLCLGDTLAFRKNMEAAIKIANSHFEDAASILNYRKLITTVDVEKLTF